jgi:GH25 family lysozyme M1 (1,4-beta-N-acetylmuramidase)
MALKRGDTLITAHSNGKYNHVAMVLVGNNDSDAKPQTHVTPSVPTTTPIASKYKVIDVSVWQGTINWAEVKADGVVGAIIRYADGKTLDSKFDYNMKQAKANGLHIGAYIFSRAKTASEAQDEATRLYDACKPYAPDLPLYIDLEASGLGKYADIVAQAYLNKMKMLGGRGGVYANLTWWNKYLTGTAKAFSSSPFWIAQYNDKITHKIPSLFGMWQYSSSGSVKGISGKVDMDWLYRAYWEDAPKPTPTPTLTPTPIDKLVIDGKGGTATVKALQRFLGKPQDGVISGQTKSLAKYYPSLEAVEFGKGGSVCVTFLQKWLGIHEDGVWGQGTSTALQTKLGVTADGIFGTNSMKALQKYLNEHDKAVYPKQTIIDKEMQACPIQADWMKDYTYTWSKWKPRNVAMSAKYGTCVTYVACVLQRIGVLKSGQFIWHNSNGKADGVNSKMTVLYMSGSLRTNRAKLQRGDIVMAGDKTDTESGSHIFILNGTWDSKGNPYIWDNQSAVRVKKGRNGLHTYGGGKKIIAVIRLK